MVVKRPQPWVASRSNFRQASIFRQSDFGNQFVASHVLTRTKFANCARLSSLLAVSARIRFLPHSPSLKISDLQASFLRR
jgi:hypothetical protein